MQKKCIFNCYNTLRESQKLSVCLPLHNCIVLQLLRVFHTENSNKNLFIKFLQEKLHKRKQYNRYALNYINDYNL